MNTQSTSRGTNLSQVGLDLAASFPAPSLEEWKAVATADLKGAPIDKKLVWQTPEGIPVPALQTRIDLEKVPHLGSRPGEFPYVRGTEPATDGSALWQIRQDCLLPTPEEVNAAIRDGLARGQHSVGIRLDNAARRGFDGDEAEATLLAGRGGVTITSISGVRMALQDVDLERVSINWRTGAAALATFAMFLAVASERGVNRRLLTGSVEGDPIRELVKHGQVRGGSIKLRFRELAEMVSFCSRECPGIRPVVVNSQPFHNAGATIVQELGATIAVGIEYLRQLKKLGVNVDLAAAGMLFSFSVSPNCFMEIAKLRAARMLWAKVCDASGVANPASARMLLHARTSSQTKSIFDAHNNLIRSTVEAFAAGVGGCDSLYVAPFDEAIGTPDELSMRLARNQQILLQEEAHIGAVADPAGGSYLIESLTDSIAREAWAFMQKIEGQGGVVAALSGGMLQKEIMAAAQKKREALAKRRDLMVGISSWSDPTEPLPQKSHIPRAEFVEERRRRIARHRATRPNAQTTQLLSEFSAALGKSGLGAAIEIAIRAAAAGATIGELTRAAQSVGRNEEVLITPTLPAFRNAATYESLRRRMLRWQADRDRVPTVALLTFGPPAMQRARAEFSQNFLGTVALRCAEVAVTDNLHEWTSKLQEMKPVALVACSDDESYPVHVPSILEEVAKAMPNVPLYVAGNPASAEQLTAAGVAGFIHLKSNAVEELDRIITQIEAH